MNALILCAGDPVLDRSGTYTSREFDALQNHLLNAEIQSETEKKIARSGRRVLCGEGLPARMTAEIMLDESEAETEPLLNEIPVVSAEDTAKKYPYPVWMKKAEAQRKRADSRQPESRKDVRKRAETLLSKLEESDAGWILVTYPKFLTEFLDVLRTKGYIAARSEIGKIRPMEKIVVSHRKDHCGGCSHNCFLSNPGCGVGKDKAARQARKQK